MSNILLEIFGGLSDMLTLGSRNKTKRKEEDLKRETKQIKKSKKLEGLIKEFEAEVSPKKATKTK